VDPIKQLEQAIQSARAQLASADGDARSALEAEIGQKSAKLADLKREQEQEYASDHDELIALRQTVNDQKIREQAKGVATIVAQGVKSAAVAEQERVRGMISDELNAALGLENGSPLDIKALVAGALGDIRTGRKFRYDAPEVIDGELVDDDNDAAGAGYGQGRGGGRKAASAGYGYAPRQGQGRTSASAGKAFVKPQGKASFPEFVAAAFRGDIGRIAAIQEAHGYDVGAGGKAGGLGRKALVEGGGAISAVTGPSGGYLVPVDFSTEMIERLYAETILRAAGVNIQTVTSPLYRQPRLSGGSSATYVGETAPIPLSQPTFDQVAAQLKKLTILSSISSELVNDSDPQVMDIVKEDIVREIGLKEDISFLTGPGGAGIPTGILTAAFGGQVIPDVLPATGDEPSYRMATHMFTQLKVANVPMKRQFWLMHPLMVEAWQNVVDGNGRPLFMDYMDVQVGDLVLQRPALFRRPIFESTQLPLGTVGGNPTSSIALVEASQITIVQKGELEMKVSDEGTAVDGNGNTISAVQNDVVLVRAIYRHDIYARHPEAVVVRNDVRLS